MSVTAPIMECVTCSTKYSEQDALDGKFFPRERICYNCYLNRTQTPIDLDCFGKITSSKKHLGFDQSALECRSICPDRRLCPKFAKGIIQLFRRKIESRYNKLVKLKVPRQATLEQKRAAKSFPFRAGSFLYQAFLLMQDGIDEDAFKKWAKRKKADPKRILRLFRKEERNGKAWKWIEKNGIFKINYPIN